MRVGVTKNNNNNQDTTHHNHKAKTERRAQERVSFSGNVLCGHV